MSGRAYVKKEIIQWGYVALVCVALAFTTLTGAAANTKSAETKPVTDNAQWGACLSPVRLGEQADRQTCQVTASVDAPTELKNIIDSALAKSGLGTHKPIYPLRDDQAF